MDVAVHILEIVVGVVVTTFCLGALPFAIRVTKQLATIAAEIKNLAKGEKQQARAIDELREDVTELKVQHAQLRTNLAR